MHVSDVSKKIPNAPGVYFFLGARKEILYIGKATNLRSRVRSYFASDLEEKRSALIEQIVREAREVTWTETDSVLEAMLLEVNLIRVYKPRGNTISKDNKSYNHLVITNDTYPRVLVVRGKDLATLFDDDSLLRVFGPFPNGVLFKEALKIIRKLFKYYDIDTPLEGKMSKTTRGIIDFNRQIGLYPEPISKESYAKTIEHIILLFEGKKDELMNKLEKEMQHAAEQEEFEDALRYKKQLFALRHIADVSLIKDDSREYLDESMIRIEAYDVAHLSGDDMVGVMVVFKGGTPNKDEYRKFKIQTVTASNDVKALSEMFIRRLSHSEWSLPQLIVVDGSTAQKNAIERILAQHKLTIPVVGVVKNDAHKPERIIGQRKLIVTHKNAILFANQEAHRFAITYHKQKRRKRYQ